MKKITIIAVAALAVSFASCKKAHTCTCTQGTNTTVTTMDKVSTGDAHAACPKSSTYSYTSGSQTFSGTQSCVLS